MNAESRFSVPTRGLCAEARRHWLAPTLLAAVVGLALSAFAYVGVAVYWDAPTLQRQLDLIGENRELLVQSGLRDIEQMIDTASDRVAESDGAMDRATFIRFADGLRQRFVRFGSVAWAPRITRDGRAAHEASGRQQNLDGYRIFERGRDGTPVGAADRAEYFPLFYLSGPPGQVPKAGFDLGTDPIIRKAIDRGYASQVLATSELVRLPTASEANPKPVFLALQPVYLKSGTHPIGGERRRFLAGYAVGLVDPAVLLEAILGRLHVPQGVDIYLFSDQVEPAAVPFHVRPAQARAGPAPIRPRSELESQTHWTGKLSLGTAAWTLVAVPMPGAPLFSAYDRASIVLLAGVLLTALASAFTAVARRSIARLNEAHERLSFANLTLNTAMEATPDGMLIVDRQMRILATNRRLGELLRIPEAIRESKDDRPLLDFVTSRIKRPDEFLARVRYLYEHPEEIAHEDIVLRDERVLDRHSASLFSERRDYLGRIWFFRDVTDERRASERLRELARIDGLTGLANRSAFLEGLTHACAAAKRNGIGFAVLALDVDHFKEINDKHGHGAGDAVLTEVGRRLSRIVRESDIVARPGGDEFAILLAGAADADSAGVVAAKLCAALSQPYRVEGSDVRATASIGISFFSAGAGSPNEMLAQADRALYQAKRKGRNRYCFHSPDLDRITQDPVERTGPVRAD